MELWIFETSPPPPQVRLNYGPGEHQFAHLRLPSGSGPFPVFMFIHGGFWRAKYSLDHIEHMCAALTELGVATYAIEFSRIGHATGGWPGTFEDVARAADYLPQIATTYRLDLGRITTIGHSAGGHLALWLAARHKISADSLLHTANPLPVHQAISLGGVVDLHESYRLGLGRGVTQELLGGSPADVPERYAVASPAALRPLGVPQLLVHGTADEDVPYELSRTYYEQSLALGDPCTLLTLDGIGHFEPVDPLWAGWPALAEQILLPAKSR